MDETTLHARLYRREEMPLPRTKEPGFAYVYAELRRPRVTRLLLREEYKALEHISEANVGV
jgi:hypothetical protein